MRQSGPQQGGPAPRRRTTLRGRAPPAGAQWAPASRAGGHPYTRQQKRLCKGRSPRCDAAQHKCRGAEGENGHPAASKIWWSGLHEAGRCRAIARLGRTNIQTGQGDEGGVAYLLRRYQNFPKKKTAKRSGEPGKMGPRHLRAGNAIVVACTHQVIGHCLSNLSVSRSGER
jgi:hypothetical protein